LDPYYIDIIEDLKISVQRGFLEFLLITIPLYDERKRSKNTTDPAITDTALIVSPW
jgi:hypothetical protein